MATAAVSTKGTRKTYSFEEREILISLISKYKDVDERRSDPISMCKRKSAWTQVAYEYNSTVGPQGARTALQLRRCWENMKACKRNREERKTRSNSRDGKETCNNSDEVGSCRTVTEPRTPTKNTGLPPNVLFEPTESEPFTFQSIPVSQPPRTNSKRDQPTKGYPIPIRAPLPDSSGHSRSGVNAPLDATDQSDVEEALEKRRRLSTDSKSSSNLAQTVASTPNYQQLDSRARKSVRCDDEIQILALSEYQIKVDTASMLKEEARLKLEEAHYRKEEARLRMLLISYKFERLKEN